MLPRLKPERFDDIVIEVAIVRPGPIQGGAVHPYLRRRSGEEPVSYLHPCLEPALAETLGVLLFQEQAIRVAVVAAGFSPGEADQLRRAMSRARSVEAMLALGDRFMAGATQQGMSRETAAAVFQQLSGFAGFGFCKSHAASFAWIAYQTLWLKRYHPAAFYCALLNQQPMGFYPVEVVVGDMRRHGIALLPPDINQSMWKYTPAPPCQTEEGSEGAIRIGLSAVAGLGERAWQRIATAREAGAFTGLRDLCARTRLPRDTIADLIRAGALDAFDATPNSRRNLLWALGEIDYAPDELPLSPIVTPVDLPALKAQEQMAWEYELLGLSPAGQAMQFHREALNRAGVLSVAAAKQQPAGRRVRVAGMQAVRQRPPTAKGVAFLSLEDETGLLDAIVRPEVYERHRAALKSSAVVVMEGVMQSASGAISLLAYRIAGFSLPGPDAR
jgi:error-prone DNA polymerase